MRQLARDKYLCPEASIRSPRQREILALLISILHLHLHHPTSFVPIVHGCNPSLQNRTEKISECCLLLPLHLTTDTVIDSLSAFRDSRPGLGLSVGYPHAQNPKSQAKSRLTEHRPRFHRHSCSPSNDPITPNASFFVLRPSSYYPAVTCDS